MKTERYAQLDNGNLKYKLKLRKIAKSYAVEKLGDLTCVETHGGKGRLFGLLYYDILNGAVFEQNALKCDILRQQRPAWRCYNTDVNTAISAGVLEDFQFNYVDIDPYGACWNTVEALFSSPILSDNLILAVNCGALHNIRMRGLQVQFMEDAHTKFSSSIDQYLYVCRYLIDKKSTRVGFKIEYFSGFYHGIGNQMTQFMCHLTRG